LTEASAQSYYKYRKYDYEWEKKKPAIPVVNVQFEKEDAVVLSEDVEWEVYDKSFKTVLRKKTLIKFLSQEGIDKFSKISLPESVDPAWDKFEDPLEHRVRIPKLRNLKPEVIYFASRIFDENNVAKESIVNDYIDTIKQKFDNRTNFLFDFKFDVSNLEVGDVLEVHYALYFPLFDPNRLYNRVTASSFGLSSYFRFFFHSDIAKQKINWNFIYPSNQYYVFSFNNNANPTSEKKETENWTVTLNWQWENLPACTNEVNAKLYKELPFVNYYRHNKEYGHYSEYDLEELAPYSWHYLFRPIFRYKSDIGPFFIQSFTSKKEKATNAFYQRQANEVEDKTPLNLVNQWHSYVVENFKYQNDSAYFQGEDDGLEKVGKFINNETLREISRNSFYQGMLDRSVGDYYQAKLTDNRVGEVDFYFGNKILGEQNYFYFNDDVQDCFLMPKRDQRGYWLNELPFYLINTNTILIKQSIESRFDKDNIIYYQLDKMNDKNFRNVSIDCNIELDKKELYATAQIDLVGQFSTLTRDLYHYDKCTDLSINDRYAFKLFNSLESDSIQLLSANANKKVPFDAEYKMKYNLADFFNIDKEKITFQLKDIFQHIISEGFKAENRDLTYYSDFVFKDDFELVIKFDKEVKLLEDSIDNKVENDFGSFTYKFEQLDDETISISTKHVQLQESVKATEAYLIEQIFSIIEEIENKKVVIQLSKGC